MIKGGNTANICAIDRPISKAFDRVNHHGLLIKLMNRLIPTELLMLLESWLSSCYACVIWVNVWSCMFSLVFGVASGRVLFYHLFYLCGRPSKIMLIDLRLVYCSVCTDDIFLLAPTLCQLQKLLSICESVFDQLDMVINTKKSCCLRIGPRMHSMRPVKYIIRRFNIMGRRTAISWCNCFAFSCVQMLS